MNKILITGIAGFIGSNLAKRLLDEGHDVYGVDDFSAGNPRFIPMSYWDQKGDIGGSEGSSHRGIPTSDFADFWTLRNLEKQLFDVVIHLAAQPRVGYTVEHPVESNDTNLTKSLALLNAAKGNVKRFINISSSSVYGDALEFPTYEEIQLDPRSPYALQKATMEKYCELYSQLYGMDTVSIRPFNVFGPNQLGSSPYSTAVSAWMWAAKEGRPLRSDGDGTQSRDMVYVDNVVDVIIRAMNYPHKLAGDAFNAGTGQSISNNEILDWFRKQFPGIQINSAPARLGDVDKTQADIQKSFAVLGYKPTVDFWEGLEKTREWVMKFKV